MPPLEAPAASCCRMAGTWARCFQVILLSRFMYWYVEVADHDVPRNCQLPHKGKKVSEVLSTRLMHQKCKSLG